MLSTPNALLPGVSLASQRRDSDSSTASTSSSIFGDPSPAADADTAEEVKHTLQKRDYRPRSTLHLRKYQDLSFYERIAWRGLMSKEYHELKPQTLDRGPIPRHSTLYSHAWILSHILFAPLVQQASYALLPNWKWSIWFAYPFYFVSFTVFAIKSVRHFDYWASVYGTLDEKKIGRDRMADQDVKKLAKGFLRFLVARTAGEFYLKWDRNAMPLSSFSVWTYPKFFVWLIVMDYAFYVYHRSCHEIDALWWIHGKHHQTKHPSPVLAILADDVQECIEIALVPLFATMLVPMNFFETYICIAYCMWVEIYGHTGMRADWDLPITGPILNLIGMELTIEDHDLHHRYGRGGRNFGKQSRVWDVIFGTTSPRIETYGMPGHRVD